MNLVKENEIQINYENFYIAYNQSRDIWYARYYDDEVFQNDIIIQKENLPIELFNEFEFTLEEFNILQKEATNIINNESF